MSAAELQEVEAPHVGRITKGEQTLSREVQDALAELRVGRARVQMQLQAFRRQVEALARDWGLPHG